VTLIEILPGYAVTPEDYRHRFGGLALENFRDSMEPDVFAAFVRFVGCIPGHPHLDVTKLVEV